MSLGNNCIQSNKDLFWVAHYKPNEQPMGCDVQLAAQQYSLFIPIRLVAAPF